MFRRALRTDVVRTATGCAESEGISCRARTGCMTALRVLSLSVLVPALVAVASSPAAASPADPAEASAAVYCVFTGPVSVLGTPIHGGYQACVPGPPLPYVAAL